MREREREREKVDLVNFVSTNFVKKSYIVTRFVHIAWGNPVLRTVQLVVGDK